MKKIAVNEVHVWRIPLDCGRGDDYELGVLSLIELNRAKEIHHPEMHRQYLKSRYAIRCILGGYLHKAPRDIEFDTLPQGKPVLHNSMQSQLTFNLSHSGTLGLCVVGNDVDVGVDIEKVRKIRGFEDFVSRFFNPGEAQELMACATEDRTEQFFKVWTSKEAYLKAIGMGLRTDLRLPVPPDWTLYNLDVAAGYVATLAVQRADIAVSYFDWWPDV